MFFTNLKFKKREENKIKLSLFLCELTFYSSIFLEQRFETRQNVVIFPSMILVNYHGYRGIVYVKIAKFFSPRMSNIL